MNNFNYTNLKPFKWFCLKNFPFIEANFDAITYYELLCKIVEYLNKVIESENALGLQVENITKAVTELQTYVDNYFDNLNVQEEIDNKLDEMASDGTLADIINHQIFNNLSAQVDNLISRIDIKTINELKNNEKLLENMYVNVLGDFSANDGFGSFYYIRKKLETDTESENLIFLKNNLVAVKLNNYGGTTTRSYLYGTRNTACVENINNTGIRAQIMGFNNENELATYKDRDHVITYKEFRTIRPNVYLIENVTETTVTLTSIPTNVFKGSIIDLYRNNNYNKNEKYSGIVKDINNKTITVEHWYFTNNTEIGQIPENVTVCAIDMPTKVWVNNDNLILINDSNVSEGVIAEYGLINGKYESNPNSRANGIDIVNMVGKTDFGILVRSGDNRLYGNDNIYTAYYARNVIRGLTVRNGKYLIDSQNAEGASKFRIDEDGGLEYNTQEGNYIIKTNNNKLEIDGLGLLKKLSYKNKNHSQSEEINIEDGFLHILAGNNLVMTLTQTPVNRVIKIHSAWSGSNTININGENKTLPSKKTCELYCDGTNWYDLSDVLQ